LGLSIQCFKVKGCSADFGFTTKPEHNFELLRQDGV